MNLFEGVIVGFVLGATAWTLAVHFAVALGLSFSVLAGIAPFLFLGWLVSFLLFCRWLRSRKPSSCDKFVGEFSFPTWRWLVGAAVVVLVYAISQRYVVFWIGGACFLFAAFLKHGRPELNWPTPAQPSARSLLVVAALCFFSALVSLAAHKPSSDDAFYVSVAVDALERPHLPVLKYDSMHGYAGWPIHLKVYSLQSIELLVAVISRTVRIAPLSVSHFLLPPLFAVMMVFAWGLFLQGFLPRRWLAALVGVVLLALLLGEEPRSLGNFTFVRFHQGKSALVSIMIPVIFHFGLRYRLHGRVADWLMLAASQIAALGLSCNALFLAPASGAIALLGGAPLRLRPHRVVAGLASSAYLVISGLLVRAEMGAEAGLAQWPLEALPYVLTSVLGATQRYLLLFSFLAA